VLLLPLLLLPLPLLSCMQSGSLMLQQCDISSSTGVGVCVQGAELQLDGCSVHGCAGHGVAVYGALEGELSASQCDAVTEQVVVRLEQTQ
jgi:hypothetical protein